MQFTDTHIHLQDYKSNSTPQILQSAAAVGVKNFICVTSVEEDWLKAANLAQIRESIITPAFGLHPWYLEQAAVGWEERLAAFLNIFPQACVGETGLDKSKPVPQQLQEQFFLKHIELAQEFKRPLLIHAVKAAEWLENFWPLLPERFVLHSFNGRPEFLKRAVDKGAYISFCKAVLRNRDFEKLARLVPAERLLLESDGPFQSEPWDIPDLAAELAHARGEDDDILAARIYQNSEELRNG